MNYSVRLMNNGIKEEAKGSSFGATDESYEKERNGIEYKRLPRKSARNRDPEPQMLSGPFLYYNSAKSCFFNKLFAAKERKEHIDRNLCSSFFVIFVIFRGNSSLAAAKERRSQSQSVAVIFGTLQPRP